MDTGPSAEQNGACLSSHSHLKPQNTLFALSIAPYFPFARVLAVNQEVVEGATHMQSIITLAPLNGAFPILPGMRPGKSSAARLRYEAGARDLSLAHARVHVVVPARKLRCAGRLTICPEVTASAVLTAATQSDSSRRWPTSAAICPSSRWLSIATSRSTPPRRSIATPLVRLPATMGSGSSVDEFAVHKGPTYLTTAGLGDRSASCRSGKDVPRLVSAELQLGARQELIVPFTREARAATRSPGGRGGARGAGRSGCGSRKAFR